MRGAILFVIVGCAYGHMSVYLRLKDVARPSTEA
jgi:hypothetical protein